MIRRLISKFFFKMKVKRASFKRVVFSALILLASIYFPIFLINIQFGGLADEGTQVGIASMVITALSAIFVVFQLKSSESVTCCEMLANMNIAFIENERLMFLYQKLEECYRNPELELIVEDSNDESVVHTSDLVAYFTFFEVLYEYIKHKVVSIGQLDDLFGYRFFILVHNRDVQERELYAVPSSYANIFELYGLWMEYRKINVTDKCSRLVIMQKNHIPKEYIKNKLYLQERCYIDLPKLNMDYSCLKKDREVEFHFKTLYPYQKKEVMDLQAVITAKIDDKIFKKSEENEFLESMLVDGCYGAYHGDKLVAVSIMVFNRKTKRNLVVDLEKKIKLDDYSKYLTFDTIQVHPDYRRMGLHTRFLQLAEKIANIVGAEYILATVSPENGASLKSFGNAGYHCINKYDKYDGKRYLVINKSPKKPDDKTNLYKTLKEYLEGEKKESDKGGLP